MEIQDGRRQPGDDLLVAGVLLELDRVLVEQPLETLVQGVILVFDLNESQPPAENVRRHVAHLILISVLKNSHHSAAWASVHSDGQLAQWWS